PHFHAVERPKQASGLSSRCEQEHYLSTAPFRPNRRGRVRVEWWSNGMPPLTPPLHHSPPPLLHYSITPPLHHSITPSLHHSTTPSLHHSITPSLHHSTTPSSLPHHSTIDSPRYL